MNRTITGSLSFALALSAASAALAQEEAPLAAPRSVATVSPDGLDQSARTRIALTTRATFGDADAVFSNSSAWSYEARAQVRVGSNLALTAVAPVAVVLPGGAPSTNYFGNLGVGIAGSLTPPSTEGLSWGASVEVYVPTASRGGSAVERRARSLIPALRAYEPQLYIPRLFSGRVRGLLTYRWDVATVDFELGAVPGATVAPEEVFVLLGSAAARATLTLDDTFIPYVEASASRQIAGSGEIAPPVSLSCGLHFHAADYFTATVFASFNVLEATTMLFGVDLAALIPSLSPTERARTQREAGSGDIDDFIDF